MGYTHFFTQERVVTKPEWQNIAVDVRKLFYASPVPLADGIATEGSRPEVDEHKIWFNGRSPEDFETFFLERDSSGSRREWDDGKFPFNFTKTGRRPYDLIVVAVLCIVDFYAKNAYNISSNGNSLEWQAGLEFARTTLDNPRIDLPAGVRREND